MTDAKKTYVIVDRSLSGIASAWGQRAGTVYAGHSHAIHCPNGADEALAEMRTLYTMGFCETMTENEFQAEKDLPASPTATRAERIAALCAKANAFGACRDGYPVLRPDTHPDIVAEWLQRCDPNGCHTADLARSEGFDPYDADGAWDALAAMLSD